MDVRIIAATRTSNDAFRKEIAGLFHRLNVIRIHLPPLRSERREDIPRGAPFWVAARELGVEGQIITSGKPKRR
ncbi:hypothetical protein KCP74_04750 [Salmonella enterica subsp. enterica]|nr:hypothetical protein KCP74_04750 [Salmonella enterica subsp. enterica]